MNSPRPNILLLVVDSLRADAVTEPAARAPNLRRLAAAGTWFSHCVSTATTTTPCFASILTGCFTPKHHVRALQGHSLNPELATLPEILGGVGYSTYAEVTGPLVPETGVLRGFDHVRHRPGYRQSFFGWRDDVLSLMAGMTQPWFLLLHIWEVHRPFRSPPDFDKRYDRDGYWAAVEATDTALDAVLAEAGDAVVVVTGDHGEVFPDGRLAKLAAVASRRTRRATARLGWNALDDRLMRHAVGHGFDVSEELVRVPLVFAGSTVAANEVVSQVSHVDLLPTLAELAGAEVPNQVQGTSLAQALQGGRDGRHRRSVFAEAVGTQLRGRRKAMVRHDEWKLVTDGTRSLLHRVRAGWADETRDIGVEHPAVVQSLLQDLARFEADRGPGSAGLTAEEEATIEEQLRALGYL